MLPTTGASDACFQGERFPRSTGFVVNNNDSESVLNNDLFVTARAKSKYIFISFETGELDCERKDLNDARFYFFSSKVFLNFVRKLWQKLPPRYKWP